MLIDQVTAQDSLMLRLIVEQFAIDLDSETLDIAGTANEIRNKC